MDTCIFFWLIKRLGFRWIIVNQVNWKCVYNLLLKLLYINQTNTTTIPKLFDWINNVNGLFVLKYHSTRNLHYCIVLWSLNFRHVTNKNFINTGIINVNWESLNISRQDVTKTKATINYFLDFNESSLIAVVHA